MPSTAPTIWIDADAAPRAVKEIVFRTSERLDLAVVLVANSALALPRSSRIRQVVVGRGFDVADDYIVEHCVEGDLVITADIPLAAQVVEKGAMVLKPRGEELDASNVRQRLAMRDFMEEMRASGLAGGGPPPFGKQDRARFANALDRMLTARLKR
jgi:uncharacterized protein